MSSNKKQCKAIAKKTGVRCKRDATTKGFCTNHFKGTERFSSLPAELKYNIMAMAGTKNIMGSKSKQVNRFKKQIHDATHLVDDDSKLEIVGPNTRYKIDRGEEDGFDPDKKMPQKAKLTKLQLVKFVLDGGSGRKIADWGDKINDLYKKLSKKISMDEYIRLATSHSTFMNDMKDRTRLMKHIHIKLKKSSSK